MKVKQGNPLPLGVTITENSVNFAAAVSQGRDCQLLLYRRGKTKPCKVYDMELTVGEVYSLALEDMNTAEYEYNYCVGGEVVVDPYAKVLAGKEVWGRRREIQNHEVRGVLYREAYDWEGDKPLHLPYNTVIAYSLHVRGFTRHFSAQVEYRGTFAGMIEKISYLKDLGINQIHCMPIYEFEECMQYRNYWGYGQGYYFAPKSAYAQSKDAVRELKDMVKVCHRAEVEVVLEMPFTGETPKQMIEECLRYYVMEYHVDGFILNPAVAPMDGIYADPVLKQTKIMVHQLGFQTVMRRFLKGDEGMIHDVMYWLRHNSQNEGIFNYITSHNGFTLGDLVSYDCKHNEANGENNQDGPDYNFSWNCGAEGQTRKKAVLGLRAKQMKNAFFLVLLAQGTPCILAGDEFANSQKGNNNVYCQDNPVGWIDWRGLEKHRELHDFVKKLISIRKKHPVLYPAEELKGMDTVSCGVPDVSYHGESAWRTPAEVSSRQLGVYYSGVHFACQDCFVAYNMHWLEHSFALPALPKGKRWYQVASTEKGVLQEEKLLENQKAVTLKERTIMLMIGK